MTAKFVMSCLLVAMLTQLARGGSDTDNQAHPSQTSPSPTPAEIETTVLAIIELSHPLAFDLDRYAEAVKNATGVAQLPVAVVKAFDISVEYVLPNGVLISQAKAAIAKANNVLDHQLEVTKFRAIFGGKFLALNTVEVIITVPDRSKAAAVQTSAADVAALEVEIAGHVSVAKAPRTIAAVETTVTAQHSMRRSPAIGQLFLEQIQSTGPNVGGTIQSIGWPLKDERTTPSPSPNGASSSVSIVLAVLLILLRAI